MKKYLISLLATSLIVVLISTAGATTFDAALSADNHYALYYGDGAGNVTFVGRNEVGALGSPGMYNWSAAEHYTFSVDPGQYIYVAGWSDGKTAQGWIGQFVSPSNTILTNTTDWQVHLTFIDPPPNDYSLAPSPVPDMLNYITDANNVGWSNITNSVAYGSMPWGPLAGGGIDPSAEWIWGSQMGPGSHYGEFQIFRTEVTAVPEPGTLLFLGSCLFGLAGLGRKFKR